MSVKNGGIAFGASVGRADCGRTDAANVPVRRSLTRDRSVPLPPFAVVHSEIVADPIAKEEPGDSNVVRPVSHASGALRLAKKGKDLSAHCVRVLGFDQHPTDAIDNDLGHASDAGGNDRPAEIGRLEKR